MGDQLNQQTITLPQELHGEVAKAQDAWLANGNSRRLWSADATLWTSHDESDWLGWFDIAGNKACDIGATREFARQLRPENFTDALLLGMGGSSLGPEVLAESSGIGAALSEAAGPRFHRSAAGAAFREQH